MPEDYFRPRVQPSRGPAPTEDWPDQDDPQPADSEPVDQDDLLGSFDAVRRALDASREAERAQSEVLTHGNPTDALSEEAPTRPTRRTGRAATAPSTVTPAASAAAATAAAGTPTAGTPAAGTVPTDAAPSATFGATTPAGATIGVAPAVPTDAAPAAPFGATIAAAPTAPADTATTSGALPASSPTDETVPPTSRTRAAAARSAKSANRTGEPLPTSEITPTNEITPAAATTRPAAAATPAAATAAATSTTSTTPTADPGSASDPGPGRPADLPRRIDPPAFAAAVPAAPPRPAKPVPMPRLPKPAGPAPAGPGRGPRMIEAEPAAIARVAGQHQLAPAEYAEISTIGAGGRRPPGQTVRPDGDKPRRSRGPLIAGVAVVVAAAFCAGAVVELNSGHSGNSTAGAAATPGASASAPTASAAPTPETSRAVAWVESSVGTSHVVACDPIVCGLLGSGGFTSSSLEVVAGLANLEQADVVVLTPQLRTQLGNEAGALVSPEPLAVFGSGATEVEVAAVQLNGAATYAQTMAADRAGRRTAGTALLGDSRLTVDASARALLADGLVDSRVCALLALLTGSHSVTVAGFTPIPPGAGPDVPSAGVVIATVDGQPAAGASTAATGLLATIKAQLAPYRPMTAAPGAVGGQQGLQVVYSQPGPLGLLPGTSAPPA